MSMANQKFVSDTYCFEDLSAYIGDVDDLYTDRYHSEKRGRRTKMRAGRKSNVGKTVAIVAAVILLLALVITAVLLIFGGKEKKLDKQLELGNKYLLDMNYEEAKICFEKALKIDPENAKAYIGLSDAYIGLGDYEEALYVIEDGIEALTTSSSADKTSTKAKIRRLEDKKTEISESTGDKSGGNSLRSIINGETAEPENEETYDITAADLTGIAIKEYWEGGNVDSSESYDFQGDSKMLNKIRDLCDAYSVSSDLPSISIQEAEQFFETLTDEQKQYYYDTIAQVDEIEKEYRPYKYRFLELAAKDDPTLFGVNNMSAVSSYSADDKNGHILGFNIDDMYYSKDGKYLIGIWGAQAGYLEIYSGGEEGSRLDYFSLSFDGNGEIGTVNMNDVVFLSQPEENDRNKVISTFANDKNRIRGDVGDMTSGKCEEIIRSFIDGHDLVYACDGYETAIQAYAAYYMMKQHN